MSATRALADRVTAGDRRALARAITLVESTRADHRDEAEALLEAVLPKTGKALRIGITGAPGVGKSTFTEAFGLTLIERGKRPAVLAVDPSSRRSGGSILGDKTRMAELAKRSEAFIRPSPSGIGSDGASFGGIARRSRDVLLLCEAAGFDPILVETVGVGQSETAVAEMTDLFLLLLMPAAGDDLQGIKRGIMELADLILINKADGALEAAAGRTAADYAHALRLMQPRHRAWNAEVLRCSALTGAGIAAACDKVQAFGRALQESGELTAQRRSQAVLWFNRELSLAVMDRLAGDPDLAQRFKALERQVAEGAVTPGAAARRILASWRT
ncbi:MAG TPA: methylmalonyl Co-A mutase-associated GTPase MeaB [Dongiaceae bacterium]|nr:methylmalonyl Co-A mutase-associated GTPase MeaB [Dongiaceae bacterium]